MFPERLPGEQHGYWLKLHGEIPAARADGGGVDVFQQNNRARRHGGEQIADAFVGDVGEARLRVQTLSESSEASAVTSEVLPVPGVP